MTTIRRFSRIAAASAFVTLQLCSINAHAQLMAGVKNQSNGLTGSGGDASSALGGMSLASLTYGNSSNIAGTLEYCAKNNYLNGKDASSVKHQLLSRVSGGKKPATDKGKVNGAK